MKEFQFALQIVVNDHTISVPSYAETFYQALYEAGHHIFSDPNTAMLLAGISRITLIVRSESGRVQSCDVTALLEILVACQYAPILLTFLRGTYNLHENQLVKQLLTQMPERIFDHSGALFGPNKAIKELVAEKIPEPGNRGKAVEVLLFLADRQIPLAGFALYFPYAFDRAQKGGSWGEMILLSSGVNKLPEKWYPHLFAEETEENNS